MKAKNSFKRNHAKIQGAEKANAPRSHATKAVSETGGENRPKRNDILRRHMLSHRNEKQP
jgi:hypothetical protein